MLQGPDRGRLILLFTDERPDQSDDTNVSVKLSDDAGATWGPRIGVTTAARSQFLPRLGVDPATGHLVAGWHDARLDTGAGPFDTDGIPNTDAMYALAFSDDGGDSWTTPQMVSEGASNAAASRNLIEFGDYTGLVVHVRGRASGMGRQLGLDRGQPATGRSTGSTSTRRRSPRRSSVRRDRLGGVGGRVMFGDRLAPGDESVRDDRGHQQHRRPRTAAPGGTPA